MLAVFPEIKQLQKEKTHHHLQNQPPRHVLKQRNPGRHSLFFFCAATVQLVPLLRLLDHAQLDTHTQPIAFLWTSDQPVAQAAINTKHNKHKRRTSMPTVGFETAIPVSQRPQTCALDRVAPGIGCF